LPSRLTNYACFIHHDVEPPTRGDARRAFIVFAFLQLFFAMNPGPTQAFLAFQNVSMTKYKKRLACWRYRLIGLSGGKHSLYPKWIFIDLMPLQDVLTLLVFYVK